MTVQTESFAQQSLQAIASHGSPHLSAHTHPKPRNFLHVLGAPAVFFSRRPGGNISRRGGALSTPQEDVSSDRLSPAGDYFGKLVAVGEPKVATERIIRQSGISFQRPF